MTLVKKILETAKSYIGQKEKAGNAGFIDPAFEAKMKAMGWQASQSWCAYFAELCWKSGFTVLKHPHLQLIDRLFSPSATATAANFMNNDLFKTGKKPKPGALAIWKHGNTWKGHIGIVSEVLKDGTFKCIEGNTNAAGSREGIMVAEKIRPVETTFKAAGLNLICFVYVPE